MNRGTVFTDDFSGYEIGVIGGNYSPDGEYHVVPSLSETGPWRESGIHNSFQTISRGNWQIVAENDGKHVLEQTIRAGKAWPMIVAGEPVWKNTVFDVSIRPLTKAGIRLIIFRYRTGRRFYALLLENERVAVIRRDNDTDTTLGDTTRIIDPDVYTHVKIVCDHRDVRICMNDETVLECRDMHDGSFDAGCIALSAMHLTRFADVNVIADVENRALSAMPGKLSARPRLWRIIKTPGFGTDRNLRVGDINGDGVPEIVAARRTDRMGGDNCSSVSSLAAYQLSGELLWSWGEPGCNNGHTTSDLPFQVLDWKGNGKCDIVFCKDWELLIADGNTGKIIKRMLLPKHPSGDDDRVYRIFADALHFCDLTGSGRDDCLLLKDRYRNVFAYDNNLQMLWQFTGSTGHFPRAFDFNHDGRDEILIGHTLLDSSGKVIWQHSFKDHADNLAVIPAELAGNSSLDSVVMANGDAGLHFLRADGQIMCHHSMGHAQSICVARLESSSDALSVVCNTFWGAAGITAVFDTVGNLRSDFEPMPYACLLQPVNWSRCSSGETASDLILLSTHPRQGGLIDANGNRMVMFPDDGHPVLCCDAKDIDGDGLDEVLTWDENEIWIYKADVQGRTPANYPARNPWYNESNYAAQMSYPIYETKI